MLAAAAAAAPFTATAAPCTATSAPGTAAAAPGIVAAAASGTAASSTAAAPGIILVISASPSFLLHAALPVQFLLSQTPCNLSLAHFQYVLEDDNISDTSVDI